MKANNEVTSSNSNCTSCEKPKVEVTNRFVVEEETIVVSEGGASSQTDEDIFE